MENLIKIGNAKFWTTYEGILYCQFRNSDPDYKLEERQVRLYIKAIKILCDGKAMPFLIDLQNTVGTFTIEAVTFLARTPDIVKLRISEAYVVNSLQIKLLISSYKRIYDTITPFEMFNNIETANEYCLMMKKKVYGSTQL